MGLQHLGVTLERLVEEAAKARANAYVPYSRFAVGAVALDADGNLHHGCNVENAAYGPTNCAERTALFRAIADGRRAGEFRAVAVIGDTDQPISPCGVCRQVLAELCEPDMPVVLANLRGETRVTTVSELLPGAFSPRDLNNREAPEGD
ncbi:cytidine deaminase [Cohnella sp. CIP 111063]|uniref:cytidine deaminase n=1 Tax=unclassified Cohnella TaxID=2636738 RepID=UPI000B8C47CC|nr:MULTISPECIES: cytidine deaminase [unclassified Cohnella]OXS62488.1 cytidine deaminase [Cohnella sp. CIP 111063]PRX74732.1 cytidine deaminase [Cohnella sp. SGD-V74]